MGYNILRPPPYNGGGCGLIKNSSMSGSDQSLTLPSFYSYINNKIYNLKAILILFGDALKSFLLTLSCTLKVPL